MGQQSATDGDVLPYHTGLRSQVTLDPLSPAIVAEWDQLATACNAAPFSRPGWVSAWQQAYLPGSPLSLLGVRVDGQLTACLPLLTGRLGSRAPMNSEFPELAAVVHDEQGARALVRALRAGVAGPRVQVPDVPEDSWLHLALGERGEQEAAGGAQSSRPSGHRLTSDVCDPDPDAFTQRLPSSRRKSVRRYRRRLAELGAVDHQVVLPGPELAGALQEFLQLEAAGWKGLSGTAILSRPTTRGFYSHAFAWAAERGWLQLTRLTADGRTVAANVTFHVPPVRYAVKTAYDENLRASSPGVLLSHESFLIAVRDPEISTVRILGSPDPLKTDYTTEQVAQHTHTLFSGPAAGVRARAEGRARDAAERVKEALPADVRRRLARLRDRHRD